MSAVNFIPAGFHAITPYLSVKDAVTAIRFYQHVFGATEIGRISMPGGAVAHAELQIGDARIMLAEEVPEWGNKSPATLGGSPVGIALYVADVDAIFQRALDAGAKVIEPVKDQFFGDSSGSLTDPFGHKWHILTHIENVSFDEMQRRFDVMCAAKNEFLDCPCPPVNGVTECRASHPEHAARRRPAFHRQVERSGGTGAGATGTVRGVDVRHRAGRHAGAHALRRCSRKNQRETPRISDAFQAYAAR